MKQQIQFGRSGLKGKTPKWIKTIYRVAMWLSGTWATAAVTGQVPGLTDHMAFVIGSWVTIGNVALYQFCQAFGYVDEHVPTFSKN